MNYSPRGLYVWDAWYMPRANEVHVYHLQRNRPGADVPPGVEDWLGHAVSRDLVHWEERPPAFGPAAGNPADDCQPWTGCALWHDGKGYLYYTMRGSADSARLQKIGLATATDPDRWERHRGNPIIAPDPRWYATAERPVPGIIDCRDLIVVPNPRGGWLGFYATRVPAAELPQTSAIACVRSSDLIHWEQLPPAFVPGNYACVEVPDVFELGGRWFLTCLAGHFYGNRGFWKDPHLVCGTMYAVADRPEGPYRELDDNALVAARTTAPLSCRSVLFEGRRYLLYTDRERIGRTDAGDMTFGTLTTPKELRTDGGRLLAAYCPRIECDVEAELIGSGVPPIADSSRLWGQIWQMPSARWSWDGGVTGECTSGWGVSHFAQRAESFIFEATVTIEQGAAAGLAIRITDNMAGAVVALEAGEQTVSYYEAPAFDFAEKRRTPVPRRKPLHLRVVNRREHVEVYVNDDLRLAFSRYRGIGGQVGLFVDRGRARFEGIRLRTLAVGPERGAP